MTADSNPTLTTADHSRQILSTLWTFAQTLPHAQAQTMSRQLVAVYDDIQALRHLAQEQADTLADATTVFNAMINELRTQRDHALDDLQSVRRTASQQAHTDLARDLALELDDVSAADAALLIDALLGRSNIAVSGYTMMDLRDTLRRLLEELTEERACSAAYDLEY